MATISLAPEVLVVVPLPSVDTQPCDLSVSGGNFALTAAGDLALVSGINRLLQDAQKLIKVSPQRNVFYPDLGNALAGLPGQPRPQDAEMAAMVEGLRTSIETLHTRRVLSGNVVGPDEEVQDTELNSYSISNGQVSVSMTVTTATGLQQGTVVALGSSSVPG